MVVYCCSWYFVGLIIFIVMLLMQLSCVKCDLEEMDFIMSMRESNLVEQLLPSKHSFFIRELRFQTLFISGLPNITFYFLIKIFSACYSFKNFFFSEFLEKNVEISTLIFPKGFLYYDCSSFAHIYLRLNVAGLVWSILMFCWGEKFSEHLLLTFSRMVSRYIFLIEVFSVDQRILMFVSSSWMY